MTHLHRTLESSPGLPALATAIRRDGRDALAALPPWERGFTIFWLLGPFILLTERSPADFWVSLIALVFVIRAVIRRDAAWLKPFLVRAGFVFWFWCLIAAAISDHPAYALGEAAAWFRFPLFAFATVFWLGRDRRLLHLMLAATAIGLLMMCGILTAELLIEGQKGGRLTWPYDDLVPGNYVAKTGLPVIVILTALAAGCASGRARNAPASDQYKFIPAAVFALFALFISLMAGERINFLIVLCGGGLAALAFRPRIAPLSALAGASAVVLAVGAWLSANTAARFTGDLVQGATDSSSAWLTTLRHGWLTGMENPLFGIGTGNYRLEYFNLIAARGIEVTDATRLDPHPHNFYLQFFAETGIIGLVLGTVFLWSMIWTCLRARLQSRSNVITATAFVIPLAVFWPICTTGDFFGQWGNIFLWSGVALALAAAHNAPQETPAPAR